MSINSAGQHYHRQHPEYYKERIGFWYVDHDLVPHEDFVGYREPEAIARVAKDVIQRMNLPLHGHIYDGAANMAGKFNKGKSGKSRQTDTGKETSTTGTHIWLQSLLAMHQSSSVTFCFGPMSLSAWATSQENLGKV